MLIDTHCHLNILAKNNVFDTPLSDSDLEHAGTLVRQAADHGVGVLINVGTSLIESLNCVVLAKQFEHNYAAIGIHPNDLTDSWRDDVRQLEQLLADKAANKIVAVGECGIDRHYPDHNLARQQDAFKAHIELALENDVCLIVHSRDAADETLKAIEEYKGQITKGIIHCFSQDQSFADTVISWGLVLGIGGTITYPKNQYLRDIVTALPDTSFVLETDAPFLPPQIIRGKTNSPLYIAHIAEFIAQLRAVTRVVVAQHTTATCIRLFNLTI